MPTDLLEHALASLGSPESVVRHETTAFANATHDRTKVVIAGCGHLGRLALSGARAAGLNVLAFADNDSARWSDCLDDIPICSPAHAVETHNRDAFFVAAIYNGTPLRQQLVELGCTRVVPYPMFFWGLSQYMPEEDRLELPHRILQQLDAMRRGYALLSDWRSRKEFAAQIAWRCSLDYGRLDQPDPAAEMYFGPALFQLSSEEVLVDCGAFDGDTIRMFLDRTSNAFHSVYALEPDASNRAALERYLSGLPQVVCERIQVLPFGVADFNGTASFERSGTVGSRMTMNPGTAVVECRRLDDLLDASSPTIIKMDIEGAEPSALKGGEATIRRTRPILAVCAYHKCEHLWTLPRIIADALPDYEIFLRRYAEECWETVYYAVPPERAISGMSR